MVFPLEMSLPKNTSWSSPKEMVPTLSLIPYSVTIALAILDTRSISFLAPVEISPSTRDSATRPPSKETIMSSSLDLLI